MIWILDTFRYNQYKHKTVRVKFCFLRLILFFHNLIQLWKRSFRGVGVAIILGSDAVLGCLLLYGERT